MSDRAYKNKCDCHHKCEGCCDLDFAVVPDNRPPAVDADFWADASAEGEICGKCNSGTIKVAAAGLIPLGVYTLWFLTDKGPFPAAPIDANYTADGFDPNRLIVDGDGVLDYYIAPLDYNPFKGVPNNKGGTAKIKYVAFAFHSDRTTHGRSPGEPNVNVFYQLESQMFYPRNDEDE